MGTCSHHNTDRLPKIKTTKTEICVYEAKYDRSKSSKLLKQKKGHRKKGKHMKTHTHIHLRLHAHQQKISVCEYVLCSSSSIEYEQLASSAWLMEEKKSFGEK